MYARYMRVYVNKTNSFLLRTAKINKESILFVKEIIKGIYYIIYITK